MKKIFKYRLHLMLFLPTLLFFTSCNKSTPDPLPVFTSNVGWAVGMMADTSITILHTEDGGMNWTRQTQLCTGFTDFQAISAATEEVAWAVGGKANGYGVIIRTKDKGEGWCRVGKSEDIPNVVLYAIKAYDQNIAWVAGENNTAMHTIDGGLTWQKAEFPGLQPTTFYSITQSGNKIWLAGTYDETGLIMRSSDGGNTWERQAEGVISGKLRDIQAINQETVIASGGNTVYITRNGGLLWSVLTNISADQVKDICATDVNNIWIATSNNTIIHTSDQGVNWTTIHSPFTDVSFNGITGMTNSRIWLVGNKSDHSSMIVYTEDAGLVWKNGNTDTKAILTRVSFVSGVR